jgi:hypothetical protein
MRSIFLEEGVAELWTRNPVKSRELTNKPGLYCMDRRASNPRPAPVVVLWGCGEAFKCGLLGRICNGECYADPLRDGAERACRDFLVI